MSRFNPGDKVMVECVVSKVKYDEGLFVEFNNGSVIAGVRQADIERWNPDRGSANTLILVRGTAARRSMTPSLLDCFRSLRRVARAMRGE